MAETPPMLLYEDVGPLTQQKQKLQSNDQQKQKLQNNEEAVDGRNKEEQQEEETSRKEIPLNYIVIFITCTSLIRTCCGTG